MTAQARPRPPLNLPNFPLLPILLFTLSTITTLRLAPSLDLPTPFTSPKAPLTLAHFSAPNFFLLLALLFPLRFRPLFLPPILASTLSLLGTHAPKSPALSYATGTAAVFLTLHSLLLLVFTPPPRDRPRSFWDACGLLVDMRGIGENWAIPYTPVSGSKARWYRRKLVHFGLTYAALDTLTWMLHIHLAPHFIPLQPWSRSSELSAPYLPPFGTHNPEFPYKTTVSWGEQNVYTVLSGLSILGAILGANTATQLILVTIGTLFGAGDDSWWGYKRCPDAFGPVSYILGGYGIRGWWGRGWHGLFRRSFCGTVEWLFPASARGTRGAGKGEGKDGRVVKRWARKLAMVIVPFIMSGLLHVAGTWTAVAEGEGRGWGAMRFFLMQPVGIIVEAPLLAWAKKVNGAGGVEWRRVLIGLWTLGFIVTTATGFVEEYRWSGIWNTEPLPVNFWRIGGDGGVWRWGGRWGRWAEGKEEGGVGGSWGIIVGG